MFKTGSQTKLEVAVATLQSMQANITALERQVEEILALIEAELTPARSGEAIETNPLTPECDLPQTTDLSEGFEIATLVETSSPSEAESLAGTVNYLADAEVADDHLDQAQTVPADEPPVADADVNMKADPSRSTADACDDDVNATACNEAREAADDIEKATAEIVGEMNVDASKVALAESDEPITIVDIKTSPALFIIGDAVLRSEPPASASVAMIDWGAAFPPARYKRNIHAFPAKQALLKRPLAASLAAALALWAGLFLSNPEGLSARDVSSERLTPQPTVRSMI